MTKFFPLLIMVESLGAALVHAYQGNVRQTIYWLAATTITASVTF